MFVCTLLVIALIWAQSIKVLGWVAEEVPSGNDYRRADVKSEFSALA